MLLVVYSDISAVTIDSRASSLNVTGVPECILYLNYGFILVNMLI